MISTIIPINAHPYNTKKAPKKNDIVPHILFLCKKNFNVLFAPITNTRPIKNEIFPNASKARSKNNKTPRIKKNAPNPVNATPIFRFSDKTGYIVFKIFCFVFKKNNRKKNNTKYKKPLIQKNTNWCILWYSCYFLPSSLLLHNGGRSLQTSNW